MKKTELLKFLLLSLFIPTNSYCIALFEGASGNSFEITDTITIASEPDYPPYCIVDKNGNADGFSVELFKTAAKAAGYHVIIKVGIWSRIKDDLANGKIDALPMVGRTPEREELFDFTMPYISLHGAVFVRKGTTGIKSLDDLRNKKIVVMKGDNAEEFVRRINLSHNIYTTNTFEEAFLELAEGKHDALITQRILGLNLIKKLSIKTVKPLDLQLTEFRQDFCFAVKEGDEQLLERLNEGLSIIIATDAYNEIRLKWFGHASEGEYSLNDILKILMYIMVPVIMILVFMWIIILRREVKKRTVSLNKEIEDRKKAMSALHTSEETYRNLFQNAQVGLFRTGISDGKILESNEQLAMMFGYDKREEIIAEFKAEDNYVDEGRREVMINEIKTKGFIQNFVARFYRKDRSVIWAKYTAKIYPEQGWIEGVVEDITEQKKAEQELNKLKDNLERTVEERTAELNEKIRKLDKSQKAMIFMVEDLNNITAELKEERKKLELSNSELEAFTYSVSHDLRAPLRAINGFSKFLIEDYVNKLNDEGKRFINIIISNTSKMDNLITNLLNLSKISRTEMNYSEVDMQALARSVFLNITTDDEQEQFEIDINELHKVKCDPSLIRQVWQNLLENAIKYSSGSDIKKIVISSSVHDRSIIYSVQDHGVGFDKNYTHNLFGVFNRLHKESEYKGTGVGLAIVKRIINRHGGEVWAEGDINKGAKFYFSLPDKLLIN